jgi:methyl-accepting chemotaxis protein
MMMNFTKRKNYFIEKKFQTKYLLLTIIMLLAYTLLFVTIIFAPYMLKLYLNYPLTEKAEAAKVLLLLHGTVWPWIGGVILFFGAVSIFISHKIAGPLFRMKKTLSQVTEGNLNASIKLRKWDDLKDLADHINLLIEQLRDFVITLRSDYDLLSEYIRELEHQVDSKVISEASGREIIKKVQESRKNIEAVLEKFKYNK